MNNLMEVILEDFHESICLVCPADKTERNDQNCNEGQYGANDVINSQIN